MAYTPEKPFDDPIAPIKPGIPTPAWGDADKEIVHVIQQMQGNVVFKGEYNYQDSEAGIVLTGLKAKGYYIQHQRSGTYSADTSIRAFYNNTEILSNPVTLDAVDPYTIAEMFIRSGMWVCQSTSPTASTTVNGFMQSTFGRALTEDEPYIDSLILGTSGASSGTYKVWLYE